MIYYEGVYAYRSKFDPLRLFATIEEARAFDRGWAAEFIGSRTHDDVRAALEQGSDGFRAALRFLLDETPATAVR